MKPHGKLGKEVKNWEKDLIMNLNNVNSSEEDDHRTSYVKYKLFKRDIYELSLVDRGNLEKGTIVSSEIWKFESGTHSDRRVKSCSKRWHRIFTTTGVLIFCPEKEAELMTGSD